LLIQGGGLVQGVEAVGSYAENQKIAAIRKVYQRAVHTPMLGVEVLWKAGTQP
jgi:cleavage stimulation factor subunit 3